MHAPRHPDESLINDDQAPVSPDNRTWTLGNIAALWVGIAVCIRTYSLASGMIGSGPLLGPIAGIMIADYFVNLSRPNPPLNHRHAESSSIRLHALDL